MKKTLLLILSFFSLSSSAQLLFGDKHDTYYYVELKGDSARLEVFKDQLYTITKTNDITLGKNQDPNVPYGSSPKIIKVKGKMVLLYNEDPSKEIAKIELQAAPKDNREALRKEAYYCKKSRELTNIQDSLAGPSHRSNYSIERNTDADVASADYIRSVDLLMDTLTKMITTAADKTALSYYKDIDSIYVLRTNDIFSLLNKAKYEFYYGQALVYTTATARPEVLIQYIDKYSANKPLILKVIRDHKYHDGIISRIKAYPSESYAKSEILKQTRRKNVKDKAGRGAFAALIIAEIGLIAALIIVALK
jgi:hypothetical protein